MCPYAIVRKRNHEFVLTFTSNTRHIPSYFGLRNGRLIFCWVLLTFFFKTESSILMELLSSFFFNRSVRVLVVQPYSNTDMISLFIIIYIDHLPVNSSPWLSHAYVDITFCWWDIATEIWELVNYFQRIVISRREGTIFFKTHGLCFIWVHIGTNASCCLLQARKHRLSLSRCISTKPLIICVVWSCKISIMFKVER